MWILQGVYTKVKFLMQIGTARICNGIVTTMTPTANMNINRLRILTTPSQLVAHCSRKYEKISFRLLTCSNELSVISYDSLPSAIQSQKGFLNCNVILEFISAAPLFISE